LQLKLWQYNVQTEPKLCLLFDFVVKLLTATTFQMENCLHSWKHLRDAADNHVHRCVDHKDVDEVAAKVFNDEKPNPFRGMYE